MDSFSPHITPRQFESPRSARLSDNGDDRFFTPRAFNNSSDNDDKDGRFDTARERITPRQRYGSFNSVSSTSPNPTARTQFESPRQYESPRSENGEYITPRSARNSIDFDYNKTSESTMMRNGYGIMQHRGEEKSSAIYRSEEKQNYDQGYGGYRKTTVQTNNPPPSKQSIPLPRGYNNPYTNSYNNNNNNILHNYDNGSISSYGLESVQEKKVDEQEEYTLGYGVSENDVEDLFSYCRHGRIVEMERHLDKGIPIDVRDMYGNTLLTIACQNGNKRVAKALLRRGANINARNHKGNMPLHYCYHYGYGDTLGAYLLKKGAEISSNNSGKLPFDGV